VSSLPPSRISDYPGKPSRWARRRNSVPLRPSFLTAGMAQEDEDPGMQHGHNGAVLPALACGRACTSREQHHHDVAVYNAGDEHSSAERGSAEHSVKQHFSNIYGTGSENDVQHIAIRDVVDSRSDFNTQDTDVCSYINQQFIVDYRGINQQFIDDCSGFNEHFIDDCSGFNEQDSDVCSGINQHYNAQHSTLDHLFSCPDDINECDSIIIQLNACARRVHGEEC
jgi:hypothetical protein